jgi:hypothetical protein
MKDGFPVSVAEVLASGGHPVPSEAVAIVLGICSQVTRQPAGVAVAPPITPAALFLDRTGGVALAGGAPADDDQTVQMLGRLLLGILEAADAARVPSRLRGIAARAARSDSRQTVERLAANLRRFGPEHPQAAVRAFFERWQAGRLVESVHAPERSAAEADRAVAVGTLERADLLEDEGAGRTATAAARSWAFSRFAFGVIVGLLLVLAGIGATWLSADDSLPPVPLNPAILVAPAAPPVRGNWELLDDPVGLSVKREAPGAPLPTDSIPTATTSRPHADSLPPTQDNR